MQPKANRNRAEWADHALAEFTAQVGMKDEDYETAIADLIGDLLHLAAREALDPMQIAAHGIGMFTAEHRAPGGEPYANDIVTIDVRSDEPTARMETGEIVRPWDERLRSVGGTPAYDVPLPRSEEEDQTLAKVMSGETEL